MLVYLLNYEERQFSSEVESAFRDKATCLRKRRDNDLSAALADIRVDGRSQEAFQTPIHRPAPQRTLLLSSRKEAEVTIKCANRDCEAPNMHNEQSAPDSTLAAKARFRM